MIRATFRDEVIQPLDPLPAGWSDGQELLVGEAEPAADPGDLDEWCRELDALASRADAGDDERL